MPKKEKSCTEPSQCRSCKADVLWVQWRRSGKRMPIDLEPDQLGTVVVSHNAAENLLIADKFDDSLHAGRRRFVSHFASCPAADQHRKDH
jgi:hypothetical protein